MRKPYPAAVGAGLVSTLLIIALGAPRLLTDRLGGADGWAILVLLFGPVTLLGVRWRGRALVLTQALLVTGLLLFELSLLGAAPLGICQGLAMWALTELWPKSRSQSNSDHADPLLPVEVQAQNGGADREIELAPLFARLQQDSLKLNR